MCCSAFCCIQFLLQCLFSYLFENHTLSKAAEMRKLAADVIASDPTTYDSVLLGRSNSEYVDWLRKDTSWGGEKFYEKESCKQLCKNV